MRLMMMQFEACNDTLFCFLLSMHLCNSRKKKWQFFDKLVFQLEKNPHTMAKCMCKNEMNRSTKSDRWKVLNLRETLNLRFILEWMSSIATDWYIIEIEFSQCQHAHSHAIVDLPILKSKRVTMPRNISNNNNNNQRTNKRKKIRTNAQMQMVH